jgi:hypothetical protein
MWPLGRVTAIVPSRDGSARVVSLRTKNGEILRPLSRLFPLEMQSPPSSRRTALEASPNALPDSVPSGPLKGLPVSAPLRDEDASSENPLLKCTRSGGRY